MAEFFGFAWKNKAWWIVPIVLVLLLLSLLIVAGSSVAPAFIYTLFETALSQCPPAVYNRTG